MWKGDSPQPAFTGNPMVAMTNRSLRTLGGRQLLHDAVQDELKRFIAENSLRPGDSLPSEAELARQLGVGRNSVREAVKSLEALGVLEARVGSGLFVRELSLDPVVDYLAYATLLDFKRMADIRQIRLFMELGAVETVLSHVTDEQLANMRRILAEWRETTTATNRYFPEMDRAFHEACWEQLGNPLLSDVLKAFWDLQHEARQRGSTPDPAEPAGYVDRHAAIYEAMASGDPTALRTSITNHYARPQRTESATRSQRTKRKAAAEVSAASVRSR